MSKKIKSILAKKNKSKIVSLTAYSKNIAIILDKYVDIILVGDSMANVLYAHKNTHNISLENIIQHTTSVKKGTKKSLLVVNMPKGTYENKNIAEKNYLLKTPLLKDFGCKVCLKINESLEHLNSKKEDFIKTMFNEASRMSSLVKDLLSLTRIERIEYRILL